MADDRKYGARIRRSKNVHIEDFVAHGVDQALSIEDSERISGRGIRSTAPTASGAMERRSLRRRLLAWTANNLVAVLVAVIGGVLTLVAAYWLKDYLPGLGQ